MITCFALFAIKAIAERLNSLHIDTQGRTPESILHSVKVEDLPVKSYLTLFCPIYVLDARLQSSGRAGPPKWVPRSRIGVYLGHSPYHAGSVALVWNPTTGRVSPQFHVVFDDDFSTVPSMVSGTIPPNWGELLKHSSEMATPKDVNLADTWLYGQSEEGASDQLTDPFAVVVDHHDSQKATNPGQNPVSHTNPISLSEGDGSPGISSPLPEHDQLNHAAADSFARSRMKSRNGRAGTEDDIFGPAPSTGNKTHDSSQSLLLMPKRNNPHENSLRRSPRLRERREKEELRNAKPMCPLAWRQLK